MKSTGINLRLFDDQGVEIYQEDLKFIQKDKLLYASDGIERFVTQVMNSIQPHVFPSTA